MMKAVSLRADTRARAAWPCDTSRYIRYIGCRLLSVWSAAVRQPTTGVGLVAVMCACSSAPIVTVGWKGLVAAWQWQWQSRVREARRCSKQTAVRPSWHLDCLKVLAVLDVTDGGQNAALSHERLPVMTPNPGNAVRVLHLTCLS